MPDLSDDLAATGLHRSGGIALERMAEGVIGGKEEPSVSAGLDQRSPGAIGEHPRVVSPVNGIRVALGSGQVRCGCPRRDKHLVLVGGYLTDGQGHRGRWHIHDQVYLIGVVSLVADVRVAV